MKEDAERGLVPADASRRVGAPHRRELSLATISLLTVGLFGAVSLGLGGSLLVASTSVWRAAELVESDVQAIAAADELDRTLRDYHRLSSIWVITQEPTVDMTRAELESEASHLLEELQRVTDPREGQLLAALSGDIRAYLATRKALEASGLPLEDIVRKNRPAFDRALETITSLRSADQRHLSETKQEARRVQRFQYMLALAVVIVLVAGLVVVTLGFRRLVLQPLLSLENMVRRFRDGDTEARAAVGAPREMRGLASAFNEMVDTITMQRRDQLTFLAAVAHDLRNPLSALKMLVQSLERAPAVLTPERCQRLDGLLDRLNRLVGDLLDATKIEAGHLELEREVFDLRDTARTMVDLYAATTENHEVVLTASHEPVLVCADPLRIEQVISNLLSNAIKYSPKGGRVEVSVKEAAGHAELSVSDRGVGIPAEDMSNVFQPFRRRPSTAGSIPGVGLGLSIARRIVRGHGGHIDVESRPDVGSTFRVSLEAWTGGDLEDRAGDDETRPPERERDAAPESNGDPKWQSVEPTSSSSTTTRTSPKSSRTS